MERWTVGYIKLTMPKKDTPIYEELHCILNAKNLGHVIIIDDARCFGTDPAYPSLEELKEFIKSKNPNVKIAVQDDSIRVTPKPQSSNNTAPDRYACGMF